MSFRIGVFIEAISDRAEAGKKTGAVSQGAATGVGAQGKPVKRRAAPRKPGDVLCVEPRIKNAPPRADVIEH
jgi:hypothetical protein